MARDAVGHPPAPCCAVTILILTTTSAEHLHDTYLYTCIKHTASTGTAQAYQPALAQHPAGITWHRDKARVLQQLQATAPDTPSGQGTGQAWGQPALQGHQLLVTTRRWVTLGSIASTAHTSASLITGYLLHRAHLLQYTNVL